MEQPNTFFLLNEVVRFFDDHDKTKKAPKELLKIVKI
jgi:hypothetical protein